MDTIFSLITVALLYKIKLIDERKMKNFEKFKNYLRRENLVEEQNGVLECDAWLEKDIQPHLLAYYDAHKNDEGRKQALLDYYRDFRDNEQARIQTWALAMINSAYLISYQFLHLQERYKIIITIFATLASISIFLKQPKRNIFNNRIANITNNQKCLAIYKKTIKEIEVEILNSKYQ